MTITKTKTKIIIWLGVIGVLCSCTPQTGAQSPSTRNGQRTRTDTTLLHLIEINQHLAEEADRQVAQYSEGYALNEIGFWARGLKTVAQPLQEGEQVEMRISIYGLDSTLYESVAQTYTIGKIEHAQAVVEVLQEMEHGQHVSILAPWYVAFGGTGAHNVPPYTNVRIEIEVN